MKRILLSIASISFLSGNCVAQLTITPSVSSATLVNTLLGSNINVSNITFTGIPTAAGTFTCQGTCNVGLGSGIILTSGSASLASAPNTGTGTGSDNGQPGDVDLTTLANNGFSSYDACVLEFDFTVPSDTAEFRYIFFSEEYSDYVPPSGNFNDIFAFLISGPGITGVQNIALIPGTTTPVAIWNVNNGYSPYGVVPTGPCMNCSYFIDNTLSTYTMTYDGMTTILTARMVVQPAATYHIKMAVADVGDHVFDSGIFMEAGSFMAAPHACLKVNGQTVCGDTVHICQGDSAMITAPTGPNYLWNTGQTVQSIFVSQPGSYICTFNGSTTFAFTYPVVIAVDSLIPVPVISQAADTLFSSITSPDYFYSWSLNGNPITGAYSPQLYISQNGCYSLQVSYPFPSCPAVTDTFCVVNVGNNSIEIMDQVSFSPNPFSDFTILGIPQSNGESYQLRISDATGKLVRITTEIKDRSVRIERENLGSGIYFYILENRDGIFSRGKMVVK